MRNESYEMQNGICGVKNEMIELRNEMYEMRDGMCEMRNDI